MTPEFQFEPYSTRYRPQNAYWLARAAQLVYARTEKENPAPNQEFILRELQAWDSGFSEVITFDNKSTQAFVAKHEGGGIFGNGFVIIAFRGTDETSDWIDNLGLMAVDFPRGRSLAPIGRVHSGFYEAFLDIWENKDPNNEFTIKELLQQEEYRKKAFWVTGHSLGGALASLCSFHFAYYDIPFYGTYTFGQPRSCDRQLMRMFNMEAKSRYFRFQNNNDIVSRIPQRLAGYSHVGTFIYIDTNDNLSTDIGFWFQFEDRVDGAKEFLTQLKGGFFRDHDMSAYIACLEKNIGQLPKGM